MNNHLRERVEGLLQRYSSVFLATCGPAGPQLSIVTYTLQHLHLQLTLPSGSDHLFNLETQPLLVLMTAGWRLHGQGRKRDNRPIVIVTGTYLHVFSDDRQHIVETIDF